MRLARSTQNPTDLLWIATETGGILADQRETNMGRAKPVVLSTRTFAKQGDAWVFFRAMLARYRPGDRVSDEDGEDLLGLLRRHPDASAKIGAGVDHFEVQEADYDTQCFRVVRHDGTWERFSYHVCIAPDRDWG